MNNPIKNNSIETTSDSQHKYYRRQEFFNYLNSEINSLHDEIQRPGWTKWAILGAISTLVWLLLHSIESDSYLSRNITAFLLIIFLTEYIYLLIVSSFSTKYGETKGRFLPYNIMSSSRPLILSMTGQFIFIIFAVRQFSGDVPSIVTLTTYVLFSFFIAQCVLVFILFTIKFPFPTFSRGLKQRKIINSILAVIIAILIWQYITYFLASNSIITVSNIRLALLIAAIFYLIRMLLTSKRGNFILQSLIKTRRELTLDEIGLDTAINYADIAITGLRSVDIFEEHINNLLTLYGDACIRFKKMSEALGRIECVITKKATSISDEELTSIIELIPSIENQSDEVKVLVEDKIPKALNPINRRMLWIKSITAMPNVLDEVYQKLDDAQNEVMHQADEVTGRLENNHKLIKKLERSIKDLPSS